LCSSTGGDGYIWLQEDGTNDALESTLETLRRRLLKHNETVLDGGLADGRISKEQVRV